MKQIVTLIPIIFLILAIWSCAINKSKKNISNEKIPNNEEPSEFTETPKTDTSESEKNDDEVSKAGKIQEVAPSTKLEGPSEEQTCLDGGRIWYEMQCLSQLEAEKTKCEKNTEKTWYHEKCLSSSEIGEIECIEQDGYEWLENTCLRKKRPLNIDDLLGHAIGKGTIFIKKDGTIETDQYIVLRVKKISKSRPLYSLYGSAGTKLAEGYKGYISNDQRLAAVSTSTLEFENGSVFALCWKDGSESRVKLGYYNLDEIVLERIQKRSLTGFLNIECDTDEGHLRIASERGDSVYFDFITNYTFDFFDKPSSLLIGNQASGSLNKSEEGAK